MNHSNSNPSSPLLPKPHTTSHRYSPYSSNSPSVHNHNSSHIGPIKSAQGSTGLLPLPTSHSNTPSQGLLPLPPLNNPSFPTISSNPPPLKRPPLAIIPPQPAIHKPCPITKDNSHTNSQNRLNSKQPNNIFYDLNADPGEQDHIENNNEKDSEKYNGTHINGDEKHDSPVQQHSPSNVKFPRSKDTSPSTSNLSSPTREIYNSHKHSPEKVSSPLIKELPPAKHKSAGLLEPPPRPQWPIQNSNPSNSMHAHNSISVVVPPKSHGNGLLPTPPLPRTALLSNPIPYPSQTSLLPLPSPTSYYEQSQSYPQFSSQFSNTSYTQLDQSYSQNQHQNQNQQNQNQNQNQNQQNQQNQQYQQYQNQQQQNQQHQQYQQQQNQQYQQHQQQQYQQHQQQQYQQHQQQQQQQYQPQYYSQNTDNQSPSYFYDPYPSYSTSSDEQFYSYYSTNN